MKFVLVRHGESIQNTGNGIGIIDQKVELTEKGNLQTISAANSIANLVSTLPNRKITVLYSPYTRTKKMVLQLQNVGLVAEFMEEPLVSEIQCGDFEGFTLDTYKEFDPVEYNKMHRYKDEGARFWYRYKNGESPFDVNTRANLLLMKLKDCNSDIVVIISHLFFLKTLEMNLLREDLIWMEKAKSFQNAEIHVIEKNEIIANIIPKIE